MGRKEMAGERIFSNLAALMKSLPCIPHSNASSERTFSMVRTGVPKPGGVGDISSQEFGEKCSIFGEDFFFGLHLICSPEQNRGRGSSPQC